MREIRVEKDRLLETLQTNRERHVDTFEQVLEDYRAKAIEMLNEHIERIKGGAVEKVAVVLPPPENYEEEYDRAIQMIEWHEGTTVSLTESEFTEYVMDQWTWKARWAETNATYTVH